MCRQKPDNFGNWRHFERCADDNDKIDEVFIMLHQTLVEAGWKAFAKERDIGLPGVRTF